MHLEVRRKGKGKLYYLSHSIRQGAKIRKARVYLGKDLSKSELEKKKKQAEPALWHRVEARKAIRDPFETVLFPRELEELRALEARGNIKVLHLSEEDWRKFTETFAYNTNAIEGSALDSEEVADILERDKWPNKPKEDISEAYGVAKAIGFIRKTRERISLQLIQELHRLVFSNSKPFAGQFRRKGVEVVVTDGSGQIVHRGAPAICVKRLLKELEKWYEKNKRRYPPLVLAAVAHNQFENIHPFKDGNGRVGRLLLNNILLKHGLPPVNIELRNRQEYYAALQAYENRHDLRPTMELLLKEYRAFKRTLRKV
jgi:Fic family protein